MTSTAATATIATSAHEDDIVQEVAAMPRARRFGIRRSAKNSEGGFTLVEVMVVVLIIGILLAIGVPTFLGARNRAHDRAAQSSLRTAQNTALIIYTDNATFRDATQATMKAAEPQITWYWHSNASNTPNIVSIHGSGDGTQFGAASMSKSGICFFLHLRSDGSTQYGSSDSTACTAVSALTVTGTGW